MTERDVEKVAEETDIVRRIAAYDSSNGGHSDAAGGSAYDLLRECSDEIIALRAELSALGGRDEAIDGLGDFLYAIEPIAARPGPYGATVSISPVEARLLLSALRRPATGEG